jgi:hypothetical protein
MPSTPTGWTVSTRRDHDRERRTGEPGPYLSVASRPISVAISALTGDRPALRGYAHFLVIRRRCRRRTVPGLTRRHARTFPGRYRIGAAMTARSA